ncbi:MAG: hypothetical protein AMJ79_01465 [Phycisphaerae bacterium SM23_30]|nr:MAG: hypothetical protein AMJ79_01465 [Phycisphaerae bacterium SM23_30]
MKIFIAILVTFFATAIIIGGVVAVVQIRGGLAGGMSLAVRVENPQRGDLIEVITAPGEVEPIRKVEIRSKITAQIVELPFKEGDRVTKGDPNAVPPIPPSVLARLDSKDLEADLRAATIRYEAQAARIEISRINLESRKERLKGDRAVLEQAERELKRNEILLKTGDVKQTEVEQQRSNVQNLRAQLMASELSLKADQQNLEAAKLDLEAADAGIIQKKEQIKYTILTAPMNGIITRAISKAGEMATGSLYNPGTMIMEVADLSQMMLVAQVDEADIGKIKVGQQAKVHIQAWPDRVFEGVVATTALAPAANPRVGEKYFEAKILLDNQDMEIFSGLTADVDIEIKTHQNELRVPSKAVLDREIDELPLEIREDNPNIDTTKVFAVVVYRIIDGEAIATPVKFGKSDATHTIILSGITDEDQIIIGPDKILEGLQHKLKVKDERQMTEEEVMASRRAEDKILEAAKRRAQVDRERRRRDR